MFVQKIRKMTQMVSRIPSLHGGWREMNQKAAEETACSASSGRPKYLAAAERILGHGIIKQAFNQPLDNNAQSRRLNLFFQKLFTPGGLSSDPLTTDGNHVGRVFYLALAAHARILKSRQQLFSFLNIWFSSLCLIASITIHLSAASGPRSLPPR